MVFLRHLLGVGLGLRKPIKVSHVSDLPQIQSKLTRTHPYKQKRPITRSLEVSRPNYPPFAKQLPTAFIDQMHRPVKYHQQEKFKISRPQSHWLHERQSLHCNNDKQMNSFETWKTIENTLSIKAYHYTEFPKLPHWSAGVKAGFQQK